MEASMSEPYLGEIKIVGFSFAPRGWALCNGQLLPISGNEALYSLFATTYGGDGRSNFALPDLRGRVPIHMGNSHVLGEKGGEENHTLAVTEMTTHTHNPVGFAGTGVTPNPAGNLIAQPIGGASIYSPAGTGNLNPLAVGTAGGGLPHENRMPLLTLTFIIALAGIFPSAN
jgi:microcystin-dependent protein